MHRRIPLVLAAMTPFPFAIDAEQTVDAAMEMMNEHGIHHLPVLHDGKLAGVISARDIALTSDVLEPRPDGVQLAVWAVCSRDPYVVEVDTRLDVVADRIAELHIGSALVTKHGKLAGIVTVTDLCRALASLLRERFDGGDGGEDVVA